MTIRSDDIESRISVIIDQILIGKRDPRIRVLASKILTSQVKGEWSVPEKDWRAEVEAIFNYVRENVRYTRDIDDVELFQSPRRTLELKMGDCDDLTILLGSLLQSVGYPVWLRVIGLKGTGTYQHIYILTGIPPHAPTEVIALDASRSEGAGWEVEAYKVGLKQDYVVEE